MRSRSVALAIAGVVALVLGLWVLDWWSLRLPNGELHANLRSIEACSGARCETVVQGGIFPLLMLIAGNVLALATALVAALSLTGTTPGPMLVKLQVGCSLLAMGGAGVLLSITPTGLGGADFAIGAWVTLAATIVCAAAGITILKGDDPLGEGARYTPVKVDVSQEVVDANVKMMGATIPPFAVAQRMASTSMSPYRDRASSTSPVGAPAATGATVPPWQPAVKDLAHTDAQQPRRRSTRAPHTAPPSFDAARMALRFVVADATIGDAGLVVTLEDHRKLDLPWKAFTRAAARLLPPDPPFNKLVVVDLCTVGGQPLRFLPSTRVNYAALDGGAAPNSRENLRRLVAHVKAKQPTFGLEHDSSAFFAGAASRPRARRSSSSWRTTSSTRAGSVRRPYRCRERERDRDRERGQGEEVGRIGGEVDRRERGGRIAGDQRRERAQRPLQRA